MKIYWVKQWTGGNYLLLSGKMLEEDWLHWKVWTDNSEFWVLKTIAKKTQEEAIATMRQTLQAEVDSARQVVTRAEQRMGKLYELADQVGGAA